MYITEIIGHPKPSSSSTVKDGVENLNPSNNNSVTVTAQWELISRIDDFDFVSPDGGEQTWSAPYNGYYKLEVWGASGENYDNSENNLGGMHFVLCLLWLWRFGV